MQTTVTPFSSWLDNSVSQVLESMCFLSVEEDTSPEESEDTVWVNRRLEFRGPEEGSFGVSTSLSTARVIACNLLGLELEEVDDAQAGEAVGEIANMVCGAFLGLFEAAQAFDLTHPEPETISTSTKFHAGRISRRFIVENGKFTAWIEIESSK